MERLAPNTESLRDDVTATISETTIGVRQSFDIETSNIENDSPDPRKKPEVEPEKLPDEDPGVQPDTKPRKDDDDDNDDDDDDYEPYEEPEIGDDPDEIKKRTTIM